MRKALATLIADADHAGRGAARASHYAVADVPRLVTPAQVEKLHKANVNTTEELLDKAAKGKDRKALAKASGLPAAELLGLARRCDLLRIKGVGSEMVLLFEAAGVKSTADLVKQDAAGLMTAVTERQQDREDHRETPDRAPARGLDRPGQEAAAGRRGQSEVSRRAADSARATEAKKVRADFKSGRTSVGPVPTPETAETLRFFIEFC